MNPGLVAIFGIIVLWVGGISAYITHLVWSIKLLMKGTEVISQMVLAGLGLVVPPVGIVHGVILWFS